MSQFLCLVKVQLRQRFGLSALKTAYRENPKKTIMQALVYVVAFVGVGTIVGMYTWLLTAMVQGFFEIGMEQVFLGAVFLLSMLLVFVLGLFYLIGTLFFSKDTEFLTALPIPQRTVFASKFSQVLASEIFTSALFLLPAIIVYGLHSGAGAAYYLRGALALLLVPCIPLALSGVLSLLLMRWNALWRHRDILTTVGAVVLLVAYFVGVTYFSSMLERHASTDGLSSLIANQQGLFESIVSSFPPAGWAAQGLATGSGQLLLFVAGSVAALCVTLLIAGRIYYAGAMAQTEAVKSGRKVRLSGGSIRQSTPVFAMFRRQWRVVLRSPTYALNSLVMIIMGPLMLLVFKFMPGGTSDPELNQIMSVLEGAVDHRTLLMVIAGLFMGFASINTAASTCLSREGKLFYLLRMIPISPERQVLSMLLFGLSINSLTMLSMSLMLQFFMGLPPLIVVGAFILGLLASVAPLALSMAPDILRPKLSWNSETEAIKQNMNAILGMLIAVAYIALVGFGMYFVLKTEIEIAVLIALSTVAAFVLGAGATVVLCRAAKRSWRTIEG